MQKKFDTSMYTSSITALFLIFCQNIGWLKNLRKFDKIQRHWRLIATYFKSVSVVCSLRFQALNTLSSIKKAEENRVASASRSLPFLSLNACLKLIYIHFYDKYVFFTVKYIFKYVYMGKKG